MISKTIEIACGSSEYEKECGFRNGLLREPLGLSLFDEDLATEAAYRHFGVFDGDNIVGCLVVVPLKEGEAQLKQMAIESKLRGKGIGKRLVFDVERELIRSGVKKIWLHARESAVGFYESLGYAIVGESFLEVSIPHFKMWKLVTAVNVEACISGDEVEETRLSVTAANEGGAATVELCGEMQFDGLTPPKASIEAARAAFERPGLMVMIRPRKGDFCYSESELGEMKEQIEMAADAGADGVVFGMLQADGQLDEEALESLVELSKSLGLRITFHRAFDAVPDRLVALERLVELGVDRILTSGVAWRESGSALDGVGMLDRVIQTAKGRLEIVIGGGVGPVNAPEILKRLSPWSGTLSVHAYSGVQDDGRTTVRGVKALVDAVVGKSKM